MTLHRESKEPAGVLSTECLLHTRNICPVILDYRKKKITKEGRNRQLSMSLNPAVQLAGQNMALGQ